MLLFCEKAKPEPSIKKKRKNQCDDPKYRKQHTADFGVQDIGQYRIILSADTASEVRQLLSQKRR